MVQGGCTAQNPNATRPPFGHLPSASACPVELVKFINQCEFKLLLGIQAPSSALRPQRSLSLYYGVYCSQLKFESQEASFAKAFRLLVEANCLQPGQRVLCVLSASVPIFTGRGPCLLLPARTRCLSHAGGATAASLSICAGPSPPAPSTDPTCPPDLPCRHAGQHEHQCTCGAVPGRAGAVPGGRPQPPGRRQRGRRCGCRAPEHLVRSWGARKRR